jgi:Family of unknown function (DUF6152)
MPRSDAAKSSRIVLAAIFLALGTAAFAHHSFAMFDMSKKVTINGTVTSFEWTNPHCYIEVDVTDDSGAVKHWSIELGSPSILQQAGWKFATLKKGDKPTLVINPLRNGQAGGFLSLMTMPDGRQFTNGPTRTQ